MASSPRLLLASSSPYRRALLDRLQLEFSTLAPEVDESPLAGETPAALALRLARLKAETVADAVPGAVVIGSDQVVECQGRALGKPGTAERAERQLAELQGQTILFHSALCVTDGQALYVESVPTTVRMRRLDGEQIHRYVRLEQPLDCAGAFKSEALGISLIESLESDDPTALVGLPLIATIRLLGRFGIHLP
ncbi:Maf family protein [Wenzhouxiangella limi]|uniref:7-methyl-GTP pyrophosphatase n=1 Tax=Wenzhouxiangella limi TaxID=2707351 RepID=A0A845USL1_9GAMM|nr:Maf family nucleotide pyrophosphatase [Wenzhouxiangella limi]NDY94823.1 septum formation protein Maf [Wenzhouxiangella limi]